MPKKIINIFQFLKIQKCIAKILQKVYKPFDGA